MYQGNYYPFYMNYQDPAFWEEERLEEREDSLMRSFYPRTARDIQQKVVDECDRMDYPGSFIYDEYPDKFLMEQMCGRIKGGLEMENRHNDSLLDELIHVLLFQEMRRRRCRTRRCRRYF